MKILRLCILFVLTASLMIGSVSANEIYLPSPDEVGDLETNAPDTNPVQTSGAEETDLPQAPHAVNFKTDILLPTATCIAVSAAIFAIAFAIKDRANKKEAASPNNEE